jgi:flagellar hook protein FlgE
LSQSLEGSIGSDIGRGVYFWGTSPAWTQGSMENTGNATDLAINGRGFFMVQDAAGTNYYTRAGEFRFDKDGYLVNPDGLVVQGYELDEDGTMGQLADIVIPLGSSAPKATEEFSLTVNLDSDTTAEAAATGNLGGNIDITAVTGVAGNMTLNVVDGAAIAEETTVMCNDAGSLAGGEYFTLSSTTTDYYVWYDIDGGSVDPAVAGRTGIEVDIASGDTAQLVAMKTAQAIDAAGDFGAVESNTTVTVTNATAGDTTNAADSDTGFIIATDTNGMDTVTAGNETVTVDGSVMTVRIEDGVTTQQQIADALQSDPLISSAIPVAGASVWNLGTSVNTAFLTGGADGGSYATTLSVFDSLGNEIPLTMTFTKTTVQNQWNWEASIPSSSGSVISGSGTFTFTSEGELPNGSDKDIRVQLDTGGTTPLELTWSLFDDTGVSNGSLTGYSAPSTTTFMNQDGYPSGNLQSVSIDERGIVTGVYSNGREDFYQIALADFAAYGGLAKLGKNLYQETMASGEAMPSVAGTARLGSISPSSLEMSNVDLAQEFVKMITTQRAFQANSKVITASDELLQDLIAIVR